MKLDAYTVVLLWRPAGAPELSPEELDRLQAAHVASNARLRAAGHALTTGPLAEQPDPALRGINVFGTSIEETRKLMEPDPLVQAGRLRFDVFTWYVPAGTLGDHPAAQIDV
ncbi:MAG TPA: YciI family protein [Candidatus Dormibacteraeota bacterium]|nr:YciI family protein [Candidatus Dormibacteraeota bacterium]